jgi:2-(1,2-epoxy-1,2-dihydrophenyl)acetyl-CoA isomerase
VVDRVAWLTLNRPAASNALDQPLVRALDAALDRAEDPGVRCVVVRAAGPRFCAGGDLTTFLGEDPARRIRENATETERVLRRLGQLSQPVVAAVHGAVAGAGLAFVLNADIVLAARTTRFVAAYAGIGLTPDCGVSYLLPRVVGDRRALLMLLGGQQLLADQAEQWGLVSEVVDDADLPGRIEELARHLASDGGPAMEQTKRLLRSAWTVPRDAHAADEARTIAAALTTEIAQVRIAGFLARH